MSGLIYVVSKIFTLVVGFSPYQPMVFYGFGSDPHSVEEENVKEKSMILDVANKRYHIA